MTFCSESWKKKPLSILWLSWFLNPPASNKIGSTASSILKASFIEFVTFDGESINSSLTLSTYLINKQTCPVIHKACIIYERSSPVKWLWPRSTYISQQSALIVQCTLPDVSPFINFILPDNCIAIDDTNHSF